MRTKIFSTALIFALGLVGVLTFLSQNSESAAYLYLLYPGSALSLLITGGHGGTSTDNTFALIAGFVVNVCAYLVVCAAALRVLQYLRADRSNKIS